jgi:hypothetical protein
MPGPALSCPRGTWCTTPPDCCRTSTHQQGTCTHTAEQPGAKHGHTQRGERATTQALLQPQPHSTATRHHAQATAASGTTHGAEIPGSLRKKPGGTPERDVTRAAEAHHRHKVCQSLVVPGLLPAQCAALNHDSPHADALFWPVRPPVVNPAGHGTQALCLRNPGLQAANVHKERGQGVPCKLATTQPAQPTRHT